MDHESLARQLIGKLRGGRSQMALSRRLRRRSNVVYTWESGRRFPTAAVFFRYARLTGVDVPRAMASFLGSLPDELVDARWDEPATTAALLRHLQEGATVAALSRKLGINRVSVGRWLKGAAEPRLPDLLRLVEATSLRLLDFVDAFAPAAELPAAREAWQVLEAQRRLAYDLPWSHAVMRVLELRAYRDLRRHSDAFIARRLAIPEEEVARCLQALSDSKLIARRAGRYRVTRMLTVDTTRNPGAGLSLKGHWARVGMERLQELEPHGHDLFSYNLFNVSEADYERLRELHIAYFHELRRIIERSEPAERVALVNIQLMRLDEHP
ncbi:MAG: DUF4423 domain-containing protein [Myxococcales bacterium]|jgi:transcriptional regulator with XRE-family HTH domain